MITINREKFLNILIVALLAVAVCVTWINQSRITGLVNKNLILSQENQNLRLANTQLTEKLTTLEKEVKKNDAVKMEAILERKLQEKGSSVAGLKADLLKRIDLIKHKPVLGGTMYFTEASIRILTDKWVIAEFEDGHILGYALLKYDVKKDGKLNWSVVNSYLFE